jgi:cell wall-associated NlpC family hydrolase
MGVQPTVPDGSWLQCRHCDNHGTIVSLQDGIATQGALLFRFTGDPFSGDRPSSAHVAVSLGNGSTIEARGRTWGVGSWTTDGRGWTHAARVPGLTYDAPPIAPDPPTVSDPADARVPQWPGRFLTQPPIMTGDDVRVWQIQVRSLGWDIDVDGQYGPDSERACTELQRHAGLRIDGVVGSQTWQAAWTASPLAVPV